MAQVDITQAMAHHQIGKLAEAEKIYRAILITDPKNFDANHLLGVILLQRGDAAGAAKQINLALQVNPNAAAAHVNLGNALKSLGRFDESLTCYDRAIALEPDNGETLLNKGGLLKHLKRFDAALDSYNKYVSLNPNVASAHYIRANTLLSLQRRDEAVASHGQAIVLKPDYIEAHINRANILNDLKRHQEALEGYNRALAIKPDFAEVLTNKANTLMVLKRPDEALESYDKAIALKPEYLDALINRGNLLRDMRRLEDALASYDRALALKSGYAEVYLNRGNILRDMGRFEEALTSLDRVCTLRPDYAEAFVTRGNILRMLKRLDAALEDYKKAKRLNQGTPFIDGLYLHAKMMVCDWSEYNSLTESLRTGVQNGDSVTPPFPLLALPSAAKEQMQCAQLYASGKYPLQAPIWAGARYQHKKIRLAYLSADFHEHATAYLMAGLFELHDRERFEITAFSFGTDDKSAMRARLAKSFDSFIDVRNVRDSQIAKLIRDKEIDIAVDLKGFTQDSRVDIFAMRPAPLQVNYIGYPGTMGAPYIDYIIADPTLIPPEQERAYSEKVARLPDTYQPNDRKRVISAATPTRTELGLPEKGFVFCSFNNSYKITPDIFDIWMRLLKNVDGSVLWLLDAGKTATANLRKEARQRGIAPERLVFAARMKLEDHLARHRQVDIFLDTLPYNAHTTASDALWAGLPVLTCMGQTFASRVAGSLLMAAGLPELVTQSLEEYEKLALKLARDPQSLGALKAKINKNRDTCALFDTQRYTRNLEAAYIKMWERQQSGQAPESFNVDSEKP